MSLKIAAAGSLGVLRSAAARVRSRSVRWLVSFPGQCSFKRGCKVDKLFVPGVGVEAHRELVERQSQGRELAVT